jgi:outer membrane PBP1 activator LpoA protein
MQAVRRLRAPLVLSLLVMVAACTQAPKRPFPPGGEADAARAAEMVEAGRHLDAARLYLDLAGRTQDPALRAEFLLSAAESAREAGDWDQVRAALAQLQGLPLAPEDDMNRRLLEAEALLLERRAGDALAALGPAPAAGLPTALRIRYHRERAAALRQTGRLAQAAEALQAVDALQTDRQQRLATQTEILRTLALLSERDLTTLQPTAAAIPGGWMALALLVKRQGSDPVTLGPALDDWRALHPGHPALPELLTNYQAYLRDRLQFVSRIAVLLPQTGELAGFAAAVRDGIVLGRFELDPARRPELRFYDSSDPAGIWPLYNRAVADGAELVIGPLQKSAVAQLVDAGDLPVPVLALNQVTLERAPPDQLYLFSLSPEDEARQAAEKIWVDGGRRPAVLAPTGAWGDRVALAFEQRWTSLGGSIAGVGRYDEGSYDFSETITRLLHLDESRERHRQMQAWLGRNLEFEPRRRDDLDAIFMAARPAQALGLRPQLQFHRAADIPVYTTSHAWSGSLTPSQATDLRGVRLAEMPWLLTAGTDPERTRIATYLPDSVGPNTRLYALGLDAMRLAPHLQRLRSSRYESLEGNTGNLYMDEINQIHRQLVWLRLDTEPEIIGYAPRLDLQQAIEADAPQPAQTTTPTRPAS